MAHKCTPNLNHSHYIQITRVEFKSPTPKIKSSHRIQKHSHQIQITHTKNQIFTPNSKTLAPNLNRSLRKSNLHTEFKSLTPNSKTLAPNLNRSHRIQIFTLNSNHSHRINNSGSGLAYLLRRYLVYSIYNVP